LFLKCAAPVFGHEASITHALARRTPDLVPAVVASEPDENWLLMRDHGGRLLDAGPEAAWIDAVPRLVELQRSWIGATDDIAAAGGQMRSIADLATAVPAMLDRDGLGGRWIGCQDPIAWFLGWWTRAPRRCSTSRTRSSTATCTRQHRRLRDRADRRRLVGRVRRQPLSTVRSGRTKDRDRRAVAYGRLGRGSSRLCSPPANWRGLSARCATVATYQALLPARRTERCSRVATPAG
jgi:hypothetical protein